MMIIRSALRRTVPVVRRSPQAAMYHENVIDHYENPRNVGESIFISLWMVLMFVQVLWIRTTPWLAPVWLVPLLAGML